LTDQRQYKSSYSDLVNIWTGYAGAQHTLLAGYLAAHSFIVAAVVVLGLHAYSLSLTGNDVGLLSIGTASVALLGCFLSIQFAISWNRSIGMASLIEEHIIELEKDENFKGRKFFTSWKSVREGKADKTIPDNYLTTWGISLGRQWWARRARTIPLVLLILYLLIFVFAVTM
jgi:hypothetical protein